MPDPHVDILVYFEYEKIKYIERGWFDPRWKGLEAYGMHIRVEEYQDKITHWMPLPEPPE